MANDPYDYTLTNVLLTGFTDFDERGLPAKKYLHDDSEARQAIARLLRSDEPLPAQLRECLAALFEPEPIGDEIGDERLLTFKFRRPGNRRNGYRDSVILSHAWNGTQEKGLSVEKAISATAEKFDLSYDAVMNIWSRSRWIRDWWKRPLV